MIRPNSLNTSITWRSVRIPCTPPFYHDRTPGNRIGTHIKNTQPPSQGLRRWAASESASSPRFQSSTFEYPSAIAALRCSARGQETDSPFPARNHRLGRTDVPLRVRHTSREGDKCLQSERSFRSGGLCGEPDNCRQFESHYTKNREELRHQNLKKRRSSEDKETLAQIAKLQCPHCCQRLECPRLRKYRERNTSSGIVGSEPLLSN